MYLIAMRASEHGLVIAIAVIAGAIVRRLLWPLSVFH